MSSTYAANTEKNRAAVTSLIAAIGLTIFKAIVGAATGSLGIIAEAAHSALDLMAALMTVIALRIAAKPADSDHPYGHGKFENLSALFETLLLLVTCLWIVYEAGKRLTAGSVEIELSAWAFVVMFSSVVVDYSRSRVLMRAAKKYNSQALEADAIHFSTDIYSSCVVIFGLCCVWLSEQFEVLRPLRQADAVAAIAVAAIVFYICGKLGYRTIAALVDAAPSGIDARIIAAAETVSGVINCHNVRVRHSGPQAFVDVHINVNGDQTLRQAHELTERVEHAIQAVLPDADVTVHPEPEGV